MYSSSEQSSRQQTSQLLQDFLQEHDSELIRIADLIRAMGDRSFGHALAIFALPVASPLTLPGISAIVAIPLILISGQLLIGLSEPWLPGWIAKRSFKKQDFEKVVLKMLKYFGIVEKVIRPRWGFATTVVMERFTGLLLLILAIVIALPIPFGNMLPAIPIFVIGLGMTERDGLLIFAGSASGFAVLAVMAGAILFLFSQLIQILSGWLG